MTINDKSSSLIFWTVIVSAASNLVTLPHVFEDFVYGVPQRFSLSLLAAGFLVAIAYFAQIIGMLLSLKGRRAGLATLLLIGLGWTLGAAFEHLPEVIRSASYRQGTMSKVIVLLIIQVGLIQAVLSAMAIRRLRPNGRTRE